MTTERTSASAAAQPKAPSLRVASMVSDTVGPLPSLAALCAAGAIGSSPVAGIGWGLLAMFFVAILPYVATWKIRHPAEGGRLSVSVRAGYMGLAALTAAVGLLMLWLLGAPSQLLATVIAILVTLVVAAVTNARWGWSNHLAACAAGVAMLVVLLGPASLFAVIAIPPVAWARLRLGRHSTVELAAGTAIGVVVAGAVLAALL
jgi:putative flippase GtrA